MQYDPNHKDEKILARIGGKAILFNEEKELLVLTRSSRSSRPLGWDFSGGGFNLGENPYSGVCREINEETGLQIHHPTLFEVWSEMSPTREYTVLLGFFAKANSKKVVLSWEHGAYHWMSLKNAFELEWPSFHMQLLRKFKETSLELGDDFWK